MLASCVQTKHVQTSKLIEKRHHRQGFHLDLPEIAKKSNQKIAQTKAGKSDTAEIKEELENKDAAYLNETLTATYSDEIEESILIAANSSKLLFKTFLHPTDSNRRYEYYGDYQEKKSKSNKTSNSNTKDEIEKKIECSSMASLILGILSLLTLNFYLGIASFFLARKALKLIKENPQYEQHKSKANVGLVLGIISTILVLLLMVFVILLFVVFTI